MQTKFKIDDLVKREIYDEAGRYYRTARGRITKIEITKEYIVCQLDTEPTMWYDEDILEKVDE